MNADLIKEMNDCNAKMTEICRKKAEFWSALRKAKKANSDMYLYPLARLEKLVGELPKEEPKDEKKADKPALSEKFKAWAAKHPEYIALNEKVKAASPEERASFKDEVLALQAKLQKEFNEMSEKAA